MTDNIDELKAHPDDIVFCGYYNEDEVKNNTFAYIAKVDPRRDTGNLNQSKNLFIDCDEAHVVLICGKRGSGKSYTMGVFVEELAKVMELYPNKLSIAIVDTMGTFLGLSQENDELTEYMQETWELSPKLYENIKIFISNPTIEKIRERSRKFKFSNDRVEPLYLRPGDLDPNDWLYLARWGITQPSGSLLYEAVSDAMAVSKDTHRTTNRITIDDIIASLELIPEKKYNQNIFRNVETKLKQFISWDLFSSVGPSIRDFVEPGMISIFDLSLSGFGDKSELDSLFLSLFTRKIFVERMISMKTIIDKTKRRGKLSSDIPHVWLVIDEAHKYLQTNSYAKHDLRRWVQQGRSPGLGTMMATQNPGLFPQDIITNMDLLISHKLITKNNIDKVKTMVFRDDLDEKLFEKLPDRKGSAIIIDTESRQKPQMVYIRPRRTKHTGFSERLKE